MGRSPARDTPCERRPHTRTHAAVTEQYCFADPLQQRQCDDRRQLPCPTSPVRAAPPALQQPSVDIFAFAGTTERIASQSSPLDLFCRSAALVCTRLEYKLCRQRDSVGLGQQRSTPRSNVVLTLLSSLPLLSLSLSISRVTATQLTDSCILYGCSPGAYTSVFVETQKLDIQFIEDQQLDMFLHLEVHQSCSRRTHKQPTVALFSFKTKHMALAEVTI